MNKEQKCKRQEHAKQVALSVKKFVCHCTGLKPHEVDVIPAFDEESGRCMFKISECPDKPMKSLEMCMKYDELGGRYD